jgi:hypothetical protein
MTAIPRGDREVVGLHSEAGEDEKPTCSPLGCHSAGSSCSEWRIRRADG